MGLLCRLGLHSWGRWIKVEDSGRHDGYAQVFGNVIWERRCRRCGFHKRHSYYDPDPFDRSPGERIDRGHILEHLDRGD